MWHVFCLRVFILFRAGWMLTCQARARPSPFNYNYLIASKLTRSSTRDVDLASVELNLYCILAQKTVKWKRDRGAWRSDAWPVTYPCLARHSDCWILAWLEWILHGMGSVFDHLLNSSNKHYAPVNVKAHLPQVGQRVGISKGLSLKIAPRVGGICKTWEKFSVNL